MTGSFAYGITRNNSDIDLCVLLDISTLDLLRSKADQVSTRRSGIENERGNICLSDSLRFGKLNLLCFIDKGMYDVWKKATAFLIKKKPVTRKQAVKYIQKKMKRYLEENQ